MSEARTSLKNLIGHISAGTALLLGALVFGLGWFVSNFSYDLLLEVLRQNGVEEATMVAYAASHIVSFLGIVICICAIFVLMRRKLAAGDISEGADAISQNGIETGAEPQWPPYILWKIIERHWQTFQRVVLAAWSKVLGLACFYLPGLNYEVTAPLPSVLPADAIRMRDSSTFFWLRFGDAFPGLRAPKEFTVTSDIAHRMAILLREPLGTGQPDTPHNPLWWTRGRQDFYIQRWFRLKRDLYLLNGMELRVGRIIAVPGTSPHRCFVYVESIPTCCTRLHHNYYTPERITHCVEDFGYASDSFALYNFRTYEVSQAEDGSYESGRQIRRFRHAPEYRTRFLTKFNFLIVPNASPLRAHAEQENLYNFLDDCLKGARTPQQLIEWADHLPRNGLIEDIEAGLI